MNWLALLAALAACGDSSSASPDASPDSAPAGAAITVYAPYYDPSGPGLVPGATVLVYSAAGDLVDRELTDATGTATATAPDNATVAVVPPGGSQGHPYVWVGVARGDHLNTVTRPSPGVATTRMDIVTIPPDGDDVIEYLVGGAGYYADLTPSQATPTIAVAGTYFPDTPAVADLVGVARHGTGNQRYFVAHDVTLDVDAIDLSTVTWSDAVPIDVAISGIPADTAWLNATALQLGGDERPWVGYGMSHTGSDAFVAHFDGPPPVKNGRILHLLFRRGSANDSSAPYWTGTFNPLPDALDIGALTIDPTDVTVSDGKHVTWAAQGDLSLAQGVHILLQTNIRPVEVILPPDARAFDFPALPPELVEGTMVTAAQVTYVSSNEPGGYAALRTAGEVFRGNVYGNIVPPLGTFRLVGY